MSQIQPSSSTVRRRRPRREIAPDQIPALMQHHAVTISQAIVIENSSRSVIWDRIKRGEYQTIKDGGLRKIITSSIIERRARLSIKQ